MDRRERYERFKIKRTRKLNAIVGLLFTVSVVLLSVTSVLTPDVKFSAEENRILTQKPAFSLAGIFSKDYMQDIESYTADQFAFRDFWVSMKVGVDWLLGKREFNGVYLGKDGYLIQKLSEPDQENVKKNIEAINKYAEANPDVKVNMLLVPNAAYILQDYLPSGAPTLDQSQQLKWIRGMLSNSVNSIDISRTLKQHASDGLYYKTDHHWTTKGALLGFEAAAEELGIEDPITSYDIYTVTKSFSGTLASTSGYHWSKDSIEVYAPKNVEMQYLVTDSDDKEKRPTVYHKDALEEKDQYQVFFGGNHGLVDITTANDTKSRLLIFKDSYANCFVPFLLPYYNEIVMVDPRYYYENVQNLTESKGITDILFLYNMDTFMTDRSIADTLAE